MSRSLQPRRFAALASDVSCLYRRDGLRPALGTVARGVGFARHELHVLVKRAGRGRADLAPSRGCGSRRPARTALPALAEFNRERCDTRATRRFADNLERRYHGLIAHEDGRPGRLLLVAGRDRGTAPAPRPPGHRAGAAGRVRIRLLPRRAPPRRRAGGRLLCPGRVAAARRAATSGCGATSTARTPRRAGCTACAATRWRARCTAARARCAVTVPAPEVRRILAGARPPLPGGDDRSSHQRSTVLPVTGTSHATLAGSGGRDIARRARSSRRRRPTWLSAPDSSRLRVGENGSACTAGSVAFSSGRGGRGAAQARAVGEQLRVAGAQLGVALGVAAGGAGQAAAAVDAVVAR